MNPVKFIYEFFDESHVQSPRKVLEVKEALHFAKGDKIWMDELSRQNLLTIHEIEHLFQIQESGVICTIRIRCRLGDRIA